MALSDIKGQMKKLGMRPNKRLGQHFLVDSEVANRQVQYADIGKTDRVLEIGPGLGILTRNLCKRAGKVVAVEIDPVAAEYLQREIEGIEVIRGDVLKIQLPRFNKVVSNLPFKISSPITFKLLEEEFDMGILMYQKEFAERLAAKRGDPDYSRLSVNTYYKARIEILESVPRSSFYPEPKVDSSIVSIAPRPSPFKVHDEEHFFRLVKALFTYRRKKIGNSLLLAWRDLCDSENAMREHVSDLPNVDKRVEQLSPEEIGDLSNRLLQGKV